MNVLRSFGPIAAIIALIVLSNVAWRVSEFLPLILTGLALLFASVWIWWRTRFFLTIAWNAEGTIIAVHRGAGRARNSLYPVVRFSTVTGETVTFTGGFGTNFQVLPVGEHVIVRYDPRNPNRARIHSIAHLWFLPALLGCVGAIFTTVGLAIVAV